MQQQQHQHQHSDMQQQQYEQISNMQHESQSQRDNKVNTTMTPRTSMPHHPMALIDSTTTLGTGASEDFNDISTPRNASDSPLRNITTPPRHYTDDDSATASTEHIARAQRESEKLKTIGNSNMSKKDYIAAIDAYSQAIFLTPNGPNSHVYYSNRAAAYCYLERYAEAEMDSTKSLKCNPNYSKALARLGLSRFFLGNYNGAVQAYSRALELDPDNAASRSYLRKALTKVQQIDSLTSRGSLDTEDNGNMDGHYDGLANPISTEESAGEEDEMGRNFGYQQQQQLRERRSVSPPNKGQTSSRNHRLKNESRSKTTNRSGAILDGCGYEMELGPDDER